MKKNFKSLVFLFLMMIAFSFVLTACNNQPVILDSLQNEYGVVIEGGKFEEGSTLVTNSVTTTSDEGKEVLEILSAQDYNKEKLFQQRVKERVKLMNDYVSFMADKSKSQETRYYYRKKALPLFIGKGYEYEENGVTKQGVMMQTTSVNRPGVVTNRLLRDYFSRLVNLKYSKVNITSTEIADMKVSDLKKVDSSDGTTLYMCTVQYVQYFRGEKD